MQLLCAPYSKINSFRQITNISLLVCLFAVAYQERELFLPIFEKLPLGLLLFALLRLLCQFTSHYVFSYGIFRHSHNAIKCYCFVVSFFFVPFASYCYYLHTLIKLKPRTFFIVTIPVCIFL